MGELLGGGMSVSNQQKTDATSGVTQPVANVFGTVATGRATATATVDQSTRNPNATTDASPLPANSPDMAAYLPMILGVIIVLAVIKKVA